MNKIIALIIFFTAFFVGVNSALARGGGGGHSLGGGLILATPSQDDLDTHIASVNSAQSVNIDKFGSALEIFIDYQYRFSGTMFALQFRPSYFTQSTDGSGYNMGLTGFTVFPLLRLYPLENGFIHFFLQTGIGYGKLSGHINQPQANVSFSGGTFGALAGLGAEFCFTDEHCMVIEGNLRYLPIERNIISSTSGTLQGNLGTPGSDDELEYNNSDLKTTLSGIQGILSYQYNF